MVGLIILLVLLLAGLSTSVYLIGYRLGSESWRVKLDRVRTESRQAEQQLHDLTRDAFVAMSEHALRHRQSER